MVSSKHAFWQALLFTIFIFLVGLMFGFFLENTRANTFDNLVSKSENSLLDEQIRNQIILDSNLSCNVLFNNTFNFADRIYSEVVRLEKYDSVSQLSDDLRELHKRYDLLRVILWSEMSNIQNKCKDSRVHTIVYLFDYKSEDFNVKSEQSAFFRILTDMKNKYPENVILIPLASNLNIESIEVLKGKYNVTQSPSIIIDDKIVISDLITFEDFEKIVFNSNKE